VSLLWGLQDGDGFACGPAGGVRELLRTPATLEKALEASKDIFTMMKAASMTSTVCAGANCIKEVLARWIFMVSRKRQCGPKNPHHFS